MPKKTKEEKKHKKLVEKADDYAGKLKLDNVIVLELSSQTIKYLNRIANCGIFGATPEIVAQRFIDERIRDLVDVEDLKIIL